VRPETHEGSVLRWASAAIAEAEALAVRCPHARWDPSVVLPHHRPRDVSPLRAIAKPPWRRAVLLTVLLVLTLVLVTVQRQAVALRPEVWVPADVQEHTVG